MTTARLTVSLAPDDRTWIDKAVRSGEFTSASDFVSTLIRNHRRGVQLDNLLAEGLASGAPIAPDAGFWERKKKALKKQMAK